MLLELGHDRGHLASSPRGPFRYNLPHLPFRGSVGVLSPGALGIVDEYPYWNAVFELYRRDELKEAVRVMEQIGIGMYGDYGVAGDIVYLEAATSEESEIVRLNDRLEFEAIQAHLPTAFDELAASVLSIYAEVAEVFGSFRPGVDTLVTLLISGTTIPTAMWRDGYFTPKESYGKICLTWIDASAFAYSFRRCLLYQWAFELSAGEAEPWLLEAATILVDPRPTLPFPRLPLASELSHSLIQEEETPDAIAKMNVGRNQCRRIGQAMLGLGGPQMLLRCLKAHSAPSLLSVVESSTVRAVREIYDRSVDEVFDLVVT